MAQLPAGLCTGQVIPYFTFDQPSDQFGSFANPDITAVGEELDHKMAALLEHLGIAVPDALLTS